MIYIIKSESKHLNLKGFQSFLTWLKIPIKLIRINLKWLIAMIGYNKLAYNVYCMYSCTKWKEKTMNEQIVYFAKMFEDEFWSAFFSRGISRKIGY